MDQSLSAPLRDGDAAMKDMRDAVSKAINRIGQLRSDIEKAKLQTMTQGCSSLMKVKDAFDSGNRASAEAKRHLEGFSPPGMSSWDQKELKTQKERMSTQLDVATKSLKDAYSEFEKALKERERRDAESLERGQYGGSAPSGGVEPRPTEGAVSQSIEMKEQMQISQADAEIHAAEVNGYVAQVSAVREHVRILRQATIDMGQLAQAQDSTIDSIMDYAQTAATSSQGAARELVQTQHTQRRQNKWLYWALVLAVILCSIIIFVVVHKASR